MAHVHDPRPTFAMIVKKEGMLEEIVTVASVGSAQSTRSIVITATRRPVMVMFVPFKVVLFARKHSAEIVDRDRIILVYLGV